MSEHKDFTQPVSMNSSMSGGVPHSKDVERFIAISGSTPSGRPKAHVLLNYYEQYSDGTTKDIQILTMDKPIIEIFKHAGFVNVFLDFGNRADMDLRMLWDIVDEYKRPSNSVSYLPEEVDAGFYETPEGPKMVYFPVLDLALSPIGEEDSYMIHGYNPAFVTLAPSNSFGEPCVVQFTFMEETFTVVDELERLDPEKLQSEISEELEAERRSHATAR